MSSSAWLVVIVLAVWIAFAIPIVLINARSRRRRRRRLTPLPLPAFTTTLRFAMLPPVGQRLWSARGVDQPPEVSQSVYVDSQHRLVASTHPNEPSQPLRTGVTYLVGYSSEHGLTVTGVDDSDDWGGLTSER